GGAGNDRFDLGAGDFEGGEKIDGGLGTDTLRLTAAGTTLDSVLLDPAIITGIEVIDLAGGGNTLALTVSDLLDLSSTTNTLRVDGNTGDIVNSTGEGWAPGGGTIAIGANLYNSYTSGSGTLLIDTDITQNIT